MKCKLFRVIVFVLLLVFVIIYSRPYSFAEKTFAEPGLLMVIDLCLSLFLHLSLYIRVCIGFLVICSFSEEETIARPGLQIVIFLGLSFLHFSICICFYVSVCSHTFILRKGNDCKARPRSCKVLVICPPRLCTKDRWKVCKFAEQENDSLRNCGTNPSTNRCVLVTW